MPGHTWTGLARCGRLCWGTILEGCVSHELGQGLGRQGLGIGRRWQAGCRGRRQGLGRDRVRSRLGRVPTRQGAVLDRVPTSKPREAGSIGRDSAGRDTKPSRQGLGTASRQAGCRPGSDRIGYPSRPTTGCRRRQGSELRSLEAGRVPTRAGTRQGSAAVRRRQDRHEAESTGSAGRQAVDASKPSPVPDSAGRQDRLGRRRQGTRKGTRA